MLVVVYFVCKVNQCCMLRILERRKGFVAAMSYKILNDERDDYMIIHNCVIQISRNFYSRSLVRCKSEIESKHRTTHFHHHHRHNDVPSHRGVDRCIYLCVALVLLLLITGIRACSKSLRCDVCIVLTEMRSCRGMTMIKFTIFTVCGLSSEGHKKQIIRLADKSQQWAK